MRASPSSDKTYITAHDRFELNVLELFFETHHRSTDHRGEDQLREVRARVTHFGVSSTIIADDSALHCALQGCIAKVHANITEHMSEMNHYTLGQSSDSGSTQNTTYPKER